MNDEEFKKIHMGDFSPTKRDIELHEIAKQYHDLTEEFDQQVCRFKNEEGVAIPSSSSELRAINTNAKSVMERLCWMNRAKFSDKEIRKAIQNYNCR